MMVAFFVLLFFIAKGVFQILTWLAPALIIGALIVNYRTVLGYIQYIWGLLKNNPLMGVVMILLTVVGFPIVSGFLFAKAFFDRRVRQIMQEQEPKVQNIEYEEVFDDEDSLELPQIEKRSQEERNPYSEYLDNKD